ncbi:MULTISPECIES: GGDEF domain-containing protein [Bradyrhizobium]|jgi:diguanylate cyclase (GGDEF)-like protein|uniref:GGDEF domain-containing protein n=2 Tax=Pseudomonadota TaxID=1224 RepID=UPI00041064F2|nr:MULTISPECIES: GGDEF domain-containing protein [Bradyrhizobium]AUC97381.1 GGDEF domain-containing protein [Bradyrhizobium sp. SK17]KIU43013.1 diguanylate cyclase [Bradyrhizobium elkanii]MBK5656344.1 GGDEF domain-containing protein [Rhizobium sp.]OCX31090.1 diguanylate cyclase [Bradyrhizobium sp. UASWS1016]
MSFDPSTLYLFATMVAGMLGAMLWLFGRQENIPALKWWGTAYLLGAASVALWTVGSSTLDPFVLLGLNAIGFAACGMVWNASRIFHGRKANLPGLVLGPIAWIGAVTMLEDPATRLTIGAGIVAVYAALTASELWSERRRAMQRRWIAIVIPVAHGCVLMLPILVGDLLRLNGQNVVVSSFWVTLFSIELVLYAIGTVFVIFMMVSDRAVAVHKTAASIDPLSGMLNRRGFSEACARVIEREATAGRPVTVMIFDIDHFKSINDRFGHPAGDEILKLFSAVVVNNLRISDLSGRIGGEEFAALLPCPLEEGVLVAERVREAFENSDIVCEEGPVDTTVSIGVAGGPAGTELEVLLASADTALYQAKRGGRNRVEAAAELPLSLENWRRKTAGLPASARHKASPAQA